MVGSSCSVQYHCSCFASPSEPPPPPDLPSSSYSFHHLDNLLFCEECDSVRCERCIQMEISCYFCPNCLFEVPSASVRGEKNRCARNCFLCPQCTNTLSVVASDPPASDPPAPLSTAASIGEAPYFLQCNLCKWSSAEVGMIFEKPTGLALQLQQLEDASPDVLEFERLKEHFEPILKASIPAQPVYHSTTHQQSATLAAATSALSRSSNPSNLPKGSAAAARLSSFVAKSGRKSGIASAGGPNARSVDDVPSYKAEISAKAQGATSSNSRLSEDDSMTWLSLVGGVDNIASVEKRGGGSSWKQSAKSVDLRPQRVPLMSKKTKRCGTCRHILIKPEQKAQSIRYKIKLVAANYVPRIEAARFPIQPSAGGGSRMSIVGGKLPISGKDDDALVPGRSYVYQLAFTNPLYDPIHVRIAVQRQQPPSTTSSRPQSLLMQPPDSASSIPTTPASTLSSNRPPFSIALPNSHFTISALAEAWDGLDVLNSTGDDEMDVDKMLEGTSGAALELQRGSSSRSGRMSMGRSSKRVVPGMGLERIGNITKVGVEVGIAKDAMPGMDVKFNLLVSYTYKSDEQPSEGTQQTVAPSVAGEADLKTFAFYSVVNFGKISPVPTVTSSATSVEWGRVDKA